MWGASKHDVRCGPTPSVRTRRACRLPREQYGALATARTAILVISPFAAAWWIGAIHSLEEGTMNEDRETRNRGENRNVRAEI
jgi:hypothetical protein